MSGWADIRRGLAGKRRQLTALLRQPERAQQQLLTEILRRNRRSEFGRRYGFASIDGVSAYASRIPIQTFEDLREDIGRMMNGTGNVLCADEVLLFEETGGSTGGQKYIPITAHSIECLREAILPWLDDLLNARPGIMQGRAYWAISPAVRPRSHTKGGVPIGIDNDAVWFGAELAEAIGSTLAVPPEVAKHDSFKAWQRQTLVSLLACRDLSFVSVWSPTFFLQLLEAVRKDATSLADEIEAVQPEAASVLAGFHARNRFDWQALWPALDTISCWSSASSRRYAETLKESFPRSHLQGKGLLATEGAITLPLEDACAPVLAINSAYFEFLNDEGNLVALADLQDEASYTVIMTTAGGLYRYRLGDRVRLAGWYEASPCFEYLGREGVASDLCGEKLTEEFVRTAIAAIPGDALLVPVADQPGYLLLLDSAAVSADEQERFAALADESLMRNPQYRHARQLEQLPMLQPRRVSSLLDTYQSICLECGQRLGDIKPVTLAGRHWSETYLRIAGT
ncbi:MAG: GH3 auxin-responsive promoter family protein [Gammaproteobacteria bacterium]|nr:GH3 auxin-responsive promoter family protein [Gammaproteobacteria bacterium]MDH4313702.1 GH3 auxin-responsive promoter family protein [Gammaproteobacteria bacterium]MDH5212946.1 GH3 auxin-responsive promoter family protein [Gammaproteobacteria bacterium]